MQMGTGLDYLRSLSFLDLLGTIKDFVEVNEEINEYRKKAMKKR